MPYLPHTDDDRTLMLSQLGATSIEELLQAIPNAVRADTLDLPLPASEPDLLRELDHLATLNTARADGRSFLGGGAYHHHIPAVVSALASRGEFVTAYTPYQPEVSQGTLQVIYEWQSYICELTGLDISNASLYDAPTAIAEAVMMAVNATGRGTVIMAGSINPQYAQVLRTYCWSQGLTLQEVQPEQGCVTLARMRQSIDDQTAAVVVQSPNYYGLIEDQQALAACAHDAGALYISCVNPMALALLASPGDIGVDIAVGDAQPFGVPLAYGGPYVGFMAAREPLLRRMPGRIVGASVDAAGRRAYVMTFRTREQDIRREKATSNICSNHALCATTATIYLSYMGKQGLIDVANLCVQKAHYAAEQICSIEGITRAHEAPYFNEFAVCTPKPGRVIRDALLEHGFLAGIPLDGVAGIEHGLLLCVTEQNQRQDIDDLVRALQEVVR